MSKKKTNVLEKKITWDSFAQNTTSLYTFLIVGVFPLFTNYLKYARITLTKYYFFAGTTIILLLPILIGTIIKIISSSEYYLFFKRNISITKIFLYLYLLGAVISSLISEYRHQVWIGTGRFEGLFTIIMYFLVFFVVSEYGRFSERHLAAYGIGIIILACIAFGQYFGLNPFEFFPPGEYPQTSSFFSTIGNSNMVSGLICLSLPLFATYFVIENHRLIWLSLVASIIIFYLKLIINVDSSTVALILLTIIMVPILIWNEEWAKRISKMFLLCGLLSLTAAVESFISAKVIEGELLISFDTNKLVYLFLGVGLLLIGLSFVCSMVLTKKDISYKFIALVMIIIILIILVASLIWLYNYKGDNALINQASQVMHGNLDDRFGNNRIFLWKRSIELAKEQPVFGSGPDTFFVAFMGRFAEEIEEFSPGIQYDAAHNEYLQIWVNLGLFGLVTYLLAQLSIIGRAVKRVSTSNNILLFLAPVVCYLIQAFFSFSIVIITPIFWLMLGLLEREIQTAETQK